MSSFACRLGRWVRVFALVAALAFSGAGGRVSAADSLCELQEQAVRMGHSPVGHWGTDPDDYMMWSSHSNRLIPVYTFGTKGGGPGVDLENYLGERSVYRREGDLRRLYGFLPTSTLNPAADYGDQTNIYDLQKAAIAAGKKHVFLVVFDGMDWTMTRAAAIYAAKKIAYSSGRGTGLHFLDYTAGGTTQFGYVVTAPHNEGTIDAVDDQSVQNPGGKQPGGYNVRRAGPNPWTEGNDRTYLIGRARQAFGDELPKLVPGEHCYPDSSATATSMTTGIKTFNGAINVDVVGAPVRTIAHDMQAQGWSVGAVTSVPISHATPAAAYAHNVSRDDYQDLARDLLGMRSIAHPNTPLPGLDVLIGGGFGSVRKTDPLQGKNFQPGSRYLADEDLTRADVKNGGKYVVAVRTEGEKGTDRLRQATDEAIANGSRLLGFYGVGKFEGHLPFATANGDYEPTIGRRGANKQTTVIPATVPAAESYSAEDLAENPTLAEMTEAAIRVVSRNPKGFWLMVEAGDVDWAMHDNNLDNAIGAVFSGDKAVKVITDWVEKNSNWDESLLIVTADHGHLLTLTQPEMLIPVEK